MEMKAANRAANMKMVTDVLTAFVPKPKGA